MERSVLEHQLVEFERGAADGVHCVVFESGRFVLDEALSGVVAGCGADPDRRLVVAETTGARPDLWRGEIRRNPRRNLRPTSELELVPSRRTGRARASRCPRRACA